MDNDKNPPTTNDILVNSSRTQPSMGTSVRATRRRVDGDLGPVRIDGTDTYNQQLQHQYQNVRQILDDQQPSQVSNVDQSDESRQSFSAKRDFFEQRFKSSPLTYDSPPREQQQQPPPTQKIITTITTTTSTSPTLAKRPRSGLYESPPSVEQLLEQASDYQKKTNINSIKTDSSQPVVIERKEQYQVLVDPIKNEILRTPPASPIKPGHATDLDKAQTQAERISIDDHRAIQQLTRALQEHNITTTTNEYKRLSSQSIPILINTTTTTTTTYPSNIVLLDKNDKPVTNEFAVIDALLANPIGINNDKQNKIFHTRYNDIRTNLRNPDYVNLLKQSTIKKSKKNKSKKNLPKPPSGPLIDKETQLTESMIDPNFISPELTPLLSLKEIKKQEKKKLKTKPKQLSKTKNYQVIDAIINSPISLRLPQTFLTKYKIRPPISQTSPTPPLTSRYTTVLSPKQSDIKVKNETVPNLVKIVNELMFHHTTAPTSSTSNRPRQLIKNINQYETQLQTEAIKPRILYRYLDEQGNVLKLSPTPPSQLHEIIPEKLQQNIYRSIEPTYFNSRKIAIDDERRHFIPERTLWQNESKVPTLIPREDFEFKDKRIPHITEHSLSTARAIPVTIEHDYSKKTSSYHQPTQDNLKLNRLPLSYPYEQYDTHPGRGDGYDSDSSNSDHSITYRQYDYAPVDTHLCSRRPLLRNFSTGRSYFPSPSHMTRGISPDYGTANIPRNYIEIFRDGETKPSQVYSLPFDEPISTNHRHSRFDQYQAESHRKKHIVPSSSNSKYERSIPTSLSPHRHPYTVESSPNRDHLYFDSYLRQSKSSDYRPLRTKLQREYKITPSLLVDEWDHQSPQISSTDYNKQTTDEVFITSNQTNKT